MDQQGTQRIAKLLYRISDSSERAEVTRGIADVLGDSNSAFDKESFYRAANVDIESESFHAPAGS